MEDKNASQLLAVLIDADNTSPKWTKAIFDEIATLGEASVRRCYGDFSSPQMNGWNKVQAEFGLVPHHQPANTVGKNASDIALVIDAMDLLHSGRFDGFVLISSDSDFTRLASRIREQGLTVYGIGAKKTPEAFRKACRRFIFLENIGGENPAQTDVSVGKTPVSGDARDLILKAMDAIGQEDDWYTLGQLGQYITQANPDFDARSYGKKKLSELVAEFPIFEIKKTGGNQLMVRRRD
ncbi:NYN domain protein [Thalassovita gelatinovora]|uniref:NYN domain protein n=1 Tax=Thalassovita gelatinovora TaxID=53501 RepID=A0A0P1FAT8_THAGE|nr:NYN domain-containing protein [Thalassovita gelatinovora]QIZ80699.1 NYN domain-containing protein [Thalassovita gelatinovora]CUH65285.1 NYN domain protein [Thalassovita gelatinovora]SEQ88813.1 OST-HTH/LOTUS domain-containing protein [Thalassovita gelatinovora]